MCAGRVCVCVVCVHVRVRARVRVGACLSSVVVQAAYGGDYRVMCARAPICMAAQAAGA